MQQAYNRKEDLQQIFIEKYLETDKAVAELVDANDSELAFDNADVFRQGACRLFASL